MGQNFSHVNHRARTFSALKSRGKDFFEHSNHGARTFFDYDDHGAQTFLRLCESRGAEVFLLEKITGRRVFFA